jgi:hypothetical protein
MDESCIVLEGKNEMGWGCQKIRGRENPFCENISEFEFPDSVQLKLQRLAFSPS